MYCTHAVKPLIMCAYLMSTRSSQPHRLFLPVVTPTSFPRVWSSSPMSWDKRRQFPQASVLVMRRCHWWIYWLWMNTADYWQCSKTSSRWCCLKTNLLTSCCTLYTSKSLHDLKGLNLMSYLHIGGWWKLLCGSSYVALLWGESSDADSGGVRLDHAVNLPDVLRWHSQTRTNPAHRAVGRCHKRVRTCDDTRVNTDYTFHLCRR